MQFNLNFKYQTLIGGEINIYINSSDIDSKKFTDLLDRNNFRVSTHFIENFLLEIFFSYFHGVTFLYYVDLSLMSTLHKIP